MKALPSQERALRKRTALISAAIQEFSNQGFEIATAKSIASSAGVATGTFYQYFENKNDMLRVIAKNRFEQLQEQIKLLELNISDEQLADHSLVALFESVLDFVFDFHASDPRLHQVLEQRRTVDAKLMLIMREGEEVLKQRVRNFVKDLGVTNTLVDDVANNLFAMAEGLVHSLVFHEPAREPRSAIRIGAEMLASYFSSHNIQAKTQH